MVSWKRSNTWHRLLSVMFFWFSWGQSRYIPAMKLRCITLPIIFMLKKKKKAPLAHWAPFVMSWYVNTPVRGPGDVASLVPTP